MRYSIDRRVKRFGDGGRVVLGGDPTGLFRLSAGGAQVLDRVVGDAPNGGRAETASAVALVAHLVDRGVLHPRPVPEDGPFTAADVTVVVPVRDNPDGVARLLGSLAERPRGDVAGSIAEVLVVDDGSVDPEHLASVVADSPVAARLIRRERNGGPAAARNLGAAQVDTPLLAFVDSDCEVTPGWLDPLLGHFADPAVAAAAPRIATQAAEQLTVNQRVAAFSPVLSRGNVPRSTDPRDRTGKRSGERSGSRRSVVAAHDRVRSPLDLGEDPARVRPGGRVSYVPSAALLVRADRFHESGGFDETLRTGEDVDVIWRLIDAGEAVRYEPRSMVLHEPRSNTAAFTGQRFGYGRSAAALDARHPGQVAPARLSRWSAAIAALLLIGGPAVPLAAALAGWTTWRLRDRLEGVPAIEVVRLGLGGHWSAVRQLLRSSLRVWWPVLVSAAMISHRARRILGAAIALAIVEAHRDGVPRTVLPLALLDDLAYGAGVWHGCLDERSFRALLPDLVET